MSANQIKGAERKITKMQEMCMNSKYLSNLSKPCRRSCDSGRLAPFLSRAAIVFTTCATSDDTLLRVFLGAIRPDSLREKSAEDIVLVSPKRRLQPPRLRGASMRSCSGSSGRVCARPWLQKGSSSTLEWGMTGATWVAAMRVQGCELI